MNRVVERTRSRPPVTWARAGRFLWEVFWLPFWLGSTLPPPAAPGRRAAAVASAGRTPAILRQLDALRGAIWRQRAGILTFRTLWLALAVLDCWLALRLFTGRAIPLWPFLTLALLILPLGVAAIARARPSRDHLARTLDRSFGLRERVATATEEAQRGRLTGLRALQVVEATRVAGKVGEARAFRRRPPLREIVLAALAGLALAGLLLTLSIAGPLRTPPGTGAAPGVGDAATAGEARPGQGPGQDPRANPNGPGADPRGGTGQQGAAGQAQQGQQGQGQGQRAGQPSAQSQRDLDALAGALQDHAATREAADALAGGDYPGAAEALREAGQNARNMSPESRQGLARDLRAAANEVRDPQLARDLNAAAAALERPDAAGAQAALDKVASDVARAGDDQRQAGPDGRGAPAPSGGEPGAAPPAGQPGAGGGAGASPQLPGDQRAQPASGPSTPPLGTDGRPVELPRANGAGQPIPSQSQGGGDRSQGPVEPGSAGTGDGQLRQGEVGEAGPEVNRVPVEQRGAVERYFTPRGDED